VTEPIADVAVPTAPAERKHLYEVDVVRILTFLCVIGVHTTSHTVAPTDLALYLLLGLLHFTRNVFFTLTAFVLVYSYLHRPQPMRKFWPKRFLLVGVPYVVWSVIYFVSSNLHTGTSRTFGESVLTLIGYILTGTAWYHLYFLLVTMQVYLLLPVILWAVRKTRQHHTRLLVIAGAAQLVIIALYFYLPSSVWWLYGYTKEYFFSYEFFILAGAVAADHSATFLQWVRDHRKLIGLIVLGGAILTIAVFLIQIASGMSYGKTGTPLQPVIMVWGTAVALGFLALGTIWADRRKAGSVSARFVTLASDRSFGIFLSHPLFIWLLLWIGNDWFERMIPKPWLTPVIYVLVIACAIAFTEIARRTPLSLPLTGRPFRAKPKGAHPSAKSTTGERPDGENYSATAAG
jgi:peptidoglycan/LPS O-acetylase OafA/YrhL